jgi:hypothetical protein
MTEKNEVQRMIGRGLMPRITAPASLVDNSALRAIQQAAQERIAREQTIADAAAHALEAASRTVAALIAEVSQFQDALSADEEIALFVIGGPAGSSFFPTDIRPIDPDKVLFAGLDENDAAFMVVQHVSQLNFAMRAIRVAPKEEPRRIGFHFPDEE